MEKYYQVLGLKNNATLEEIKARYLFLVKVYHPDRYTNLDDKHQAEEELKKINEAFTILKAYLMEKEQATSTHPSQDADFKQKQTQQHNEDSETVPPRAYQERYQTYNETENSTQYKNNYCQSCGKNSHTYPATYRKNVGMLILRRYKTVSGDFCADCHESFFWNVFLTNLFLGWWGIISFVINPFLIIMNIGNYIKSWKVRPLATPYAKSLFDFKLFLPLLAVSVWLVFLFFNNNGMSEATKPSPSLTSTPQKTLVLSLTDLNNGIGDSEDQWKIEYSTDFLRDDKEWLMESYGNESFEIKDGFLNISTVKDSCAWSTSKTIYRDGILKVFLANERFVNNDQAYVIQWRSDIDEGSYGMLISPDGYISVIKSVGDNDIVELFNSKKSVIAFNNSGTSVIISFIGSKISISNDDKLITTITDYSHTSGSISLGLCTSADQGGTVFFDGVTIYSAETNIISTPVKSVAKSNKTPTSISFACRLWSDVTIADVGKELCVQGTVKNAYYDQNQKGYFILFSPESSALYLVKFGNKEYSGLVGNCIQYTGKVEKVWNTPVMKMGINDSLYQCGISRSNSNELPAPTKQNSSNPTPVPPPPASQPTIQPTIRNPVLDITLKVTNHCPEQHTVIMDGPTHLKYVVDPGKTVEWQGARGIYSWTIDGVLSPAAPQELWVSVWTLTLCD